MNWKRVSRIEKCLICNKPDWCTVSEIGSCCMRVASEHPMKNGGWLHKHAAEHKPAPIVHEPRRTKINAYAVFREFDLNPWYVHSLADELGVSPEALFAIGCAWSEAHEAWAFPMRNPEGGTIGIRLRNADGKKWAVTGSHAGLFMAEGESSLILIAEGPTDTAAGLTLGFHTIGRPSCLGLETEIMRAIQIKKGHRVIIVTDNDEPGWNGARRLAATLSVPNVIWCPPSKDLRAFVQAGGTKEIIETLTHSLVWTHPKNKENNLQPGSILQTPVFVSS